VPAGKHLRVHEGDRVRAGDRLSEGPVNPHDILRIKGPRAVQEYLLNEVQEVYRLQGVKINDKHIGVIVRRCCRRCASPIRATRSSSTGRRWTSSPSARRTSGWILRKEERAGDGGAAAARHHQGVAHDAVVHLGGVVPGDHPDADRRGDPRRADDLLGLKENIIIGHLIPAGTGMYRYCSRSRRSRLSRVWAPGSWRTTSSGLAIGH
jgi:DNA-directed RNA polymerase subunit beta'